jgi:hypothetical protein
MKHNHFDLHAIFNHTGRVSFVKLMHSVSPNMMVNRRGVAATGNLGWFFSIVTT